MKHYGMFTNAGNVAVAQIVQTAKENKLSWLETYQMLVNLSTVSCFGEATDTEVRELVYDACDFDCNFYV